MSTPLFLFKSHPFTNEIIAITPNSRKTFQDATAVVRSSVRQRYSSRSKGKCGESAEQYAISKVQYNFFWHQLYLKSRICTPL